MFGDRLTELRKQKNLRQEDIANKVGIARTTYAMYEQNKREPDFHTLQKLANFFQVSTDYLLGLTDDPHPLGDIKQESKNESLFFYDMDNITPEEAQALKEHLEFLRWKAKQVNNNEDK